MPAFAVNLMFNKLLKRSGQRSGEAASNAGRKPITHPAYGLFWRSGMSIPHFLRFLPQDCLTYAHRVLHYMKTGVPDTFIFEYAESARSLSEAALTTYLSNHYGYPGLVPTLRSLQARAANPTAETEYLSALTNATAAREEWEKIISRLIELLHWMDESNEVYEGWLDEVWEPIEPIEWEAERAGSKAGSNLDGDGDNGGRLTFPKLTPQNETALRKVYNEIDSAQENAKHEFFVIMEEIWENMWD